MSHKFSRILSVSALLISVSIVPLPAKADVMAEYAVVYSPPSNIRTEPNGSIICQVRTKKTISVYHFTTGVNAWGSPDNGWYSTSACGTNRMGWIHQSQIKLTGKYHSAP